MSKSKVTLGGDRVGSGNRMKQEMHNYFRSNHNLSCSRVTSMAPGVLYPIYTTMGLTGDTFDIDLSAFMRTLPTEGPMYGAFKLQLDVFTADARLYQAILHNNTVEIGMDMNQVLLPKIQLGTNVKRLNPSKPQIKEQIARNALLNYIGISGIGNVTGQSIPDSGVPVTRKFNALPILTYYDIFKNYYANKQEENAYVIANGDYEEQQEITSSITSYEIVNGVEVGDTDLPNSILLLFRRNGSIKIFGENLVANGKPNFDYIVEGDEPIDSNDPTITENFAFTNLQSNMITMEYVGEEETLSVDIRKNTYNETIIVKSNAINLKPFELKNIDIMRKRLLGSWDLGEEFVIDNTEELLPYKCLTEKDDLTGSEHYNESKNVYPMQGLVVKTYQSDMFNNWLETEWVNKITARSAVNVTNGSFTMDALNMAKKIYNLYNRIAIQGASYDDWQQAAYGQDVYGKCEKPVYHGGMSSEVTFDEVVSSVAGMDGEGENQPLGTLGGRGNLSTRKGGHVIIKCREHCVIMIMASLTPRVCYSEGNTWFMNLDTMDDFHKPEFDQIGFQDMIGEHMAWWDTKINMQQGGLVQQTSYGKQPAWLHYMTDVDRVYGDFAQPDGKAYMVLQRLYDVDETTGNIKDVTTYIDPSKYNYPFAVTDITAQNFWGFFNFDIKARRLMSAKQIPNI